MRVRNREPARNFGELAREYVDLNKPNWGKNTARASGKLIEFHLIRELGSWPVRELADADTNLQRFVNGYVEAGASKS